MGVWRRVWCKFRWCVCLSVCLQNLWVWLVARGPHTLGPFFPVALLSREACEFLFSDAAYLRASFPGDLGTPFPPAPLWVNVCAAQLFP